MTHVRNGMGYIFYHILKNNTSYNRKKYYFRRICDMTTIMYGVAIIMLLTALVCIEAQDFVDARNNEAETNN